MNFYQECLSRFVRIFFQKFFLLYKIHSFLQQSFHPRNYLKNSLINPLLYFFLNFFVYSFGKFSRKTVKKVCPRFLSESFSEYLQWISFEISFRIHSRESSRNFFRSWCHGSSLEISTYVYAFINLNKNPCRESFPNFFKKYSMRLFRIHLEIFQLIIIFHRRLQPFFSIDS